VDVAVVEQKIQVFKEGCNFSFNPENNTGQSFSLHPVYCMKPVYCVKAFVSEKQLQESLTSSLVCFLCAQLFSMYHYYGWAFD